MSDHIGKPERATQNRIVKLFKEELGYTYLGDWQDREDNRNIEERLLTTYLRKSGYHNQLITRAIHELRTEASNANRSLYDNNRAVYSLLRYGSSVKASASENAETVKFINWDNPEANDFAIAEEVTLKGNHTRRPDLVLYINGIAIGVIELKNSRVSIGDGIRQNISNQQTEFNEWFYSTIQLLFAGNDTEGLKYGTIETPEKFYLQWKEDVQDNSTFKLDKYLIKMCSKERLIEIIHDFILFDGGVKKLPRVHQYFGIKAAQDHVNRQQGGIIWHTQGSGKSILMVLLAKWILENKPNARVVIVTDRDELDAQINRVFHEAGENIHRTTSRQDLISQLNQATPRLLCSLVHKFGIKDSENFEEIIKELESKPTQSVGDIFVFVDECHRTQSGKLHRTMTALMPNAVYIGFTGTPLLKEDKKTSMEVFGGYIHTYKFDEAVEDEVVLDLLYEARDIEQGLGSPDKVDAWFEAKTKGLNDWQKAALREKWGTMQNVLSSRSRMERIVSDIILDFSSKQRLSSERGNAILVAASIFEACKYFSLFQKTPFKDKCAVVTSYNPHAQDITIEDTGGNSETDKEFIYSTYTELLESVVATGNMTKTEAYETQAKQLFIKQPAHMKLLVVVDKLLTGFDAPCCTYLYIDKKMRDHGLFQAICRTNRLDGEDKDFGYIVDYKDLFKNLVNEKGTGALQVYTSELDDSDTGTKSGILLQDRLAKGQEKLENAREALHALCEPVKHPMGELEHIWYFCGNTEVPGDLEESQPQRVTLYKGIASLVRAYANISDELDGAGYAANQIAQLKQEVERYVRLRNVIRNASGETIDLKAYEADMRHLLDTYIDSSQSEKISVFDKTPLLEIIVYSGITNAVDNLPDGIKKNKNAVAETIINNVRSKIIEEHLNNPAYYEEMSVLLDGVIQNLKAKSIEYEEFLQKVAELANEVQRGHTGTTPIELDTAGRRALYDNLRLKDAPYANDPPEKTLALALEIDETVKHVRPDSWRGHQARENNIKRALLPQLDNDVDEVERIFAIIKQQSEY